MGFKQRDKVQAMRQGSSVAKKKCQQIFILFLSFFSQEELEVIDKDFLHKLLGSHYPEPTRQRQCSSARANSLEAEEEEQRSFNGILVPLPGANKTKTRSLVVVISSEIVVHDNSGEVSKWNSIHLLRLSFKI